ncbi:hypothetical protein FQN54_007934 [Arachnomyces sp. PD_36]|nr:hypothetical protein FQN54_007934 [Arachnomyces sp. PD_36]
MNSDLLLLHKAEIDNDGAERKVRDTLVDIVAVHGLNEGMIDAWVEPESQKLWLRDFLPEDIPVARVLTFGYDGSPSSFDGRNCPGAVQKHAHTLVASLQADRSLEGCDRRPIIFICHGVGGLIVKKALSYSESRTSAHVAHLYSIFVSTYGILFFGTPHNSTNITAWPGEKSTKSSDFRIAMKIERQSDIPLNGDSATFEAITDQFVPMMKHFRVFFFWEGIQTQIGTRFGYVVKESSAAPILDNTERAGIDSTHTGMVKFSKKNTSKYRTVIAALLRYCKQAPTVISRRWEGAFEVLAREHSSDAFELAGSTLGIGDGHTSPDERDSPDTPRNTHFYPPQEIATHFARRKHILRTLGNGLLPSETNASALRRKKFVAYGMGGSGKTQICSKFALDNQNRYWGVFTIHATSAETIRDSFAEIGRIGGIEATERAGKHWISQLNEPWLLIIDGVDDPALNLPDLFPGGDKGHILITTRNPDLRRYATSGSVHVGDLKEMEAVQLLLKCADIPEPWSASTEAVARDIAWTLGYLALAMAEAGTTIFRKICGLEDYLDFYEHHRRVGASSKTPRDGNPACSTFNLSLSYLENGNNFETRDAVELLNIIGFCNFQPIRVDIFTQAVRNRQMMQVTPRKKFISRRLKDALAMRLRAPDALPQFLKTDQGPLDPYRVNLALHRLQSVSLISYDGMDTSFSIHPLVYTWARDRLGAGGKALWAQIALNTLTEAISFLPDEYGEPREEFKGDLLSHIGSCLVACPIHLPDYGGWVGAIQHFAAKIFQPTLLLTLQDRILVAEKCGYLYTVRGRHEDATDYLAMAQNILTQTLGYEHEGTVSATFRLADNYWHIGRLEEAINLQKFAVETQQKVIGVEARETLVATDQLGRFHWSNGEYGEALKLHQFVLDRLSETFGSDDLDTLCTLENLGRALKSLHKYDESIKLQRQVLNARRNDSEDISFENLARMAGLAVTLLGVDRLDEAEAIITLVDEELKQRFGVRPSELWMCCDIAKTYSQLGWLEEAESLLLDELETGERTFSEDHYLVLMGKSELVRVYRQQRRLCDAETLALTTIQKLEVSRGSEHPEMVYTLWELAQVYELQGKVEEAIDSCETAMERAIVRLTKEHPLYGEIESKMNSLRNRLEARESELRNEEVDLLGTG